MLGQPPQSAHRRSPHLSVWPGSGARESGGGITWVHLAFCFLKLPPDEPVHFDIVIVVELFGVYPSLMDTLSALHDRFKPELPLHLLLSDTPTNGSAHCRRVSGSVFGPAIYEGLMGVSPITLAAQLVANRPGVGHEARGLLGQN